jgi:hypothetical protein
MVMGQMEDVFAREGYRIDAWKPVKARARRRKYFYDADNRCDGRVRRQRQRHRRPDPVHVNFPDRVEQDSPAADAGSVFRE